jgi:hypothetical protein
MVNEVLIFSRLLFLLLSLQIFTLKLNFLGQTTFSSPNLLSKTIVSEPIVANLYFYWLDLSYLPLLYLSITILWFSLGGGIWPKKTPFIFLGAVFYTTGLSDFFSLNCSLGVSDYSLTVHNAFLTNNLNKYHPLIFYSSVVLLSLALFRRFTYFNNPPNFDESYQNNVFFRARPHTLLLNVTSLVFGA